jgi:hypothetical protein
MAKPRTAICQMHRLKELSRRAFTFMRWFDRDCFFGSRSRRRILAKHRKFQLPLRTELPCNARMMHRPVEPGAFTGHSISVRTFLHKDGVACSH